MNKKKIETFGEFCELIISEPENIYFDGDGKCDWPSNTKLSDLKNHWDIKSYPYYHIPPVKKKTMAYFHDYEGLMYCLSTEDEKSFDMDLIPNTEFEVDE